MQATPITSNEEMDTLEQPIATGGYVRADLRDEPAFEVPNVPASRGPMEALTDPISLVQGPEPTNNEPLDVPPNAREER